MDVTVKTLDGQNRSFCVPENITVRQFKEKIAGSINIETEVQRLIFQGRVLQDEKPLKDYDVHGKVIHVVQRPPPSTRPPGTTGTSTSTTSTPGLGLPRGDVNSYVVGSFTIPSDILDPNQVQQIVQNAVQNMGDMGRNARVSTRASNDGSSVDVHIHLGQTGGPARVESESQLRINNARRMLQMARENLTRLESPGEASGTSEDLGSERTSTATAGTQESQSNQSETMEYQESVAPSQSSESTGQSVEATQTAETSSQSTQGTQNEGSSQSGQARAGTTTDNNSQTRNQGQSHPPGLIRPPITSVADVLQEVLEVNQRLQPFLVRYQTLTRNDPQLSGEELTEAQQMCNLVGEILHAISHCYHSLSDLMIDLSQPPPRHLYAAFISQQVPTTAVIQQTIPVRAQINIGPIPATVPPVQRTSSTQSSVPTNTAGTQSNQPATNTTGTQSNVPTASASTSTSAEPVQGQEPVQPGPVGVGMVNSATTPMFIEVGPDMVSVSSVTAQIITEAENPTTSSGNTGTTTTEQQIFPGGAGPITNDLIQSIVNSVLQAHGVGGRGGPRFGPPDAIQIEIGAAGIQRNRFSRFPTAPGPVRANIPAGNQGASQTSNPSTSASSTQTNTTESTNTSGTQTGAANTSETQTQTPGRPRTTAFVMPGIPGGGFPGIGGISGMPGFPMPGFPPPIDPHLPCSSRYFFRQQARLNEQQPPRSGAQPSQARNGQHPENQNGSQPRQEQTGNMPRSNIRNPEAAVNQMVNNFMNQLLRETNPHLQPSSSSAASSASTQQTTTSSTASSTSSASSGQTTSAERPRPTSTAPVSSDPFVQMLQEASAQMPGVIGIQIQSMQDGQPHGYTMFGMPPPRPGPAPPPPRPADLGTQPPAGEQNYATMLRDFLRSASTHQRTTSASGSTNSGASSSQQPMSDEAFTRLVSGIGSMVTQTAMGQPPSQPISDFLNSLGDGGSDSEGTFVGDLFQCLSRHLTLPDLLQIFYGNPQPLGRLRTPLRDFVRGRVLNDGEPTPENIEAGVGRLVDNLQDELRRAEEATQVKPDIDFVATLSNIIRIQLIATIRFIMQPESGDQFGPQLYHRVRQAFSEVIVLTQHCLVGGRPALDQLIQNRLENITSGVNPLIQQWMGSTTTSQLNSFLPTITVTVDQISHYIVKKQKASRPEAPMEISPVIQSPGASAMDSPQSMEVDSKSEDKPSPSGAANATKEPVISSVQPDAASVEEPEINGATGGGPSTSSVGSSERDTSWQKEIPDEWVPIMNGDIQKQKTLRHQPPFSDAYYQGMPAKRRKLNRPIESVNREENLSQSIRRAASAVGVEPISSLENLTKEAEDDTELLNEYDEQMRSSIIERLRTDSDFAPNRFPKSHEYFKTNNKK